MYPPTEHNALQQSRPDGVLLDAHTRAASARVKPYGQRKFMKVYIVKIATPAMISRADPFVIISNFVNLKF